MKMLFCMALGFAMPALVWAEQSSKELLLNSARLFDKGQYEEALKTLSSLNVRANLDNSDDMKLAFKIKAIAYAQVNNEAKARSTLRELFFLDPEYRFDPFDTPKAALKLADEEKSLIAKKNERLREIRDEHVEVQNLNAESLKKQIEEKPTFNTPHTLSAFLPFGFNHRIQNNALKANLYLATQTVGLVANVGAYWWKHSYLQHFRLPKNPIADRSRFQLTQTAQYISFGFLALAYSISVVDAIISMQAKSSSQDS